MKNREFNKKCKILINKNKLFDIEKIEQLSDDQKDNLTYYIVRKMMPLIKELITINTYKWLQQMGYLYLYKNKSGYNMLGLIDHKIKYAA